VLGSTGPGRENHFSERAHKNSSSTKTTYPPGSNESVKQSGTTTISLCPRLKV
jgi:hypothetical protein